MKRTVNILIISSVLIVTTLSNMPLWKCLINGDLLLTPGCTIETLNQDCCNALKSSETTLTDSDCCKKIHSSQEFNLDNAQPSLNGKERKVLDFNPALMANISLHSPLKESINFFNNLPPPGRKILAPANPLHIYISSFLC